MMQQPLPERETSDAVVIVPQHVLFPSSRQDHEAAIGKGFLHNPKLVDEIGIRLAPWRRIDIARTRSGRRAVLLLLKHHDLPPLPSHAVSSLIMRRQRTAFYPPSCDGITGIICF